MKASDIMTTDVATVSADAGIRHAIALMLDRGVSGLPVTDDTDGMVGIVTEGDLMTRREIGRTLLARLERPEEHSQGRMQGRTIERPGELERYVKSNAWRVGDVMTTHVLVASLETSIGTLAEMMLSHKVKRLPIISDRKLAGIVSRRDLLRTIAFAGKEPTLAGDEAVRTAIRARLKSDLGLETDDLALSVSGGVVSLQLEDFSDLQRRAIRCVVEGVPGASLRERNVPAS